MMNKKGGTISWSWSILFAGAFIICIIVFASKFAIDNNAFVSVDGDIRNNNTLSGINGSLLLYQSQNNVTISGLSSSNIEAGSDTLSRVSTFESGDKITIGTITNATRNSLDAVLGGSSDNTKGIYYIAGSFAALAALITILYAWRTLKGQPD